MEDDRPMAYHNEHELTNRQQFVLILTAILAVSGIIGYAFWAGFAEAGHNRVKEERLWQECLAKPQNDALMCKVAIYGNN